jgi:DNA-binding CsgD family transcriptional regulator
LTSSVISDPFVGREREISELTTALDDAFAGRGRMAMLVGEPGIGKTRTAEELAAIAKSRGGNVLWGRCPEESGAPPYWPWVQIIRSHLSLHDADSVRAELGSGAAMISEIVADLRDTWTDLSLPEPIDNHDTARFRLFDAIFNFLKRASETRPSVLLFDNLHWSDEASLRLLEFVAQGLADIPVLVLGTYRDVDIARGHPLYHALGDMARQRLFTRILLRGLGEKQIGELVEAWADTESPSNLVEQISILTEGNPFFVREMVRLIEGEGQWKSESLFGPNYLPIRLPESIRETIGRRLDRLSEHTNRILTMAAIIGRQFELRQLSAIYNDRTDDELVAVLDEALDAHIISESADGAEQFEFTHALIQQTLADELSAARRVRAHARIATALQELYGVEADENAGQLLGHFIQAEPVLGTDPIVHYATIAGHRSLEAMDPASASAQFESGIEAFADDEPDMRLASLLAGLGHAQISALPRDKLQIASDNLTRAFDLYLQLGDESAAIQVALTRFASVHGPTGQADRLEQALGLVEDGNVEQARLLAEFGIWASHERADYKTATDALSKALAYAEANVDLRLQFRVHDNAAPVHAWNLRFLDMFNSAKEAIRLSEDLDDPGSIIDSHFLTAQYYVRTGDLASARQHADACARSAERTRNVFEWSSAMYAYAQIYEVCGEWDGARESLESGLARDPGEKRLLGLYASMLTRLGDFEAAKNRLEILTPPTRSPGTGESGNLLVFIHSASVDIPSWVEALSRRVLASDTEEPFYKSVALDQLGRVALATSDRGLALDVFRGFELLGMEPNHDRFLGRLMARVGWFGGAREAAEARFESDLSFYLRSGYRPYWAETCAYYAESLVERGTPDDTARARELTKSALPVAKELDMKPLASKLEDLSTLRLAAPTVYPDGLSEREVDVLRLVAAGYSNQKIADKLFLSRYTVNRHMSNIFGKINAGNRAEAAIYAERNGLTKTEQE